MSPISQEVLILIHFHLLFHLFLSLELPELHGKHSVRKIAASNYIASINLY